MKFGEVIEKYKTENNGRVIFVAVDNKNNIIGNYELEEYNRGDEESINTYNTYCNSDCKTINITHHMMWTKIICEII